MNQSPSDERVEALQSEVENVQYTLAPVIRTPSVNPGDEIRIDVYICGYGLPTENKLTIFNSHPQILPDSPIVGEAKLNIDGLIDKESNKIEYLLTSKALEERGFKTTQPLTKYGHTMGIPAAFFVDDITWGQNIQVDERADVEEVLKEYIPRTMSETALGGEPPLRLEFATSEAATPGDYELQLVLSYKSDGVIRNSQKEIPIHIKSKREQLEPLPTIAGMLAAVIAFLSLLHATGVWEVVWNLLLQLGDMFSTFPFPERFLP